MKLIFILFISILGCNIVCDGLLQEIKGISTGILNVVTSSAYNPDRTSDFISLDNQPLYWRASHDNLDQFIMVGSSEIKNYTKIAARAGYHKIFNSSYYEMECVSDFKIYYSMDGHTFTEYKDVNNNVEFQIICSNVDRNTTIALNPPITARTIKIVPVAYYTHISMRLEVWFKLIPNQQIGYVIAPAINTTVEFGPQYPDEIWVPYQFPQPCSYPKVSLFFKTVSLDIVKPHFPGGFSIKKYGNSDSHGFLAEFNREYSSLLREATATYISYCQY
eukprot:gene4635-5789_t